MGADVEIRVQTTQVGSQTPTYIISQEHATLKDRNDQQRKAVEDVVTERINLESKAKKVRLHAWRIYQNTDTVVAS